MNLICQILFFLAGLSRDCYGMKILHEQFWHLAGKKNLSAKFDKK